MDAEFVNLTAENLAGEHLCCIIRSKKSHPGVETKREWLSERLAEGHVFRKLHDPKATVMIEYAPLETAWVPVTGDNYIYLYCLWVSGVHKGKGYGKALMEYCLSDAKTQGKSGVCMLGAKYQKSWLSDQSFARKFGFETVDTAGGYELLALSFDGTRPKFTDSAKRQEIESRELIIYYSAQCPFILKKLDNIRVYCEANGVLVSFLPVDTLQKAKELPCVFNNFALFYRGKFETVNLVDAGYVERLLKKNESKK